MMKIKNLESRTKWLCEAEGHSYVREEIQWTNGSITITWHLNEDSTEDYEPLTDEQLETLFWQSNGKKRLLTNREIDFICQKFKEGI